MNINKFKVLLCCYTMGITGCNKIGNTSCMDGSGDGRKEKKSKGVAPELVAHGSSTTGRKTGGTNIVDNAIFFAEKSIRVAEEQLKRSKEDLNIAKDMKAVTSSNVQSSERSNRNVIDLNIAKKLVSIAKDADTASEKSLLAAEEQVKRDEETLKNAKYALELAKGNK